MPNAQATQVKVTLPEELYLLVKSRASRYGLNPSSYLRHLAITDSKDEFPTFPMSAKTEEKGLKALEEYKEGKTIKVTNIEKFFEDL